MSNQTESFFGSDIWLVLLFIAAWLVMWVAITFALSRLSGWSFLARKFRAASEIDGDKYWFVSGRMGKRFLPVNYGYCLFVTVGKAGLHLSLLIPFRLASAPLFIPWSEIEDVKTKQFLYLFPGVTLKLKNNWPQISLRGRIHDAILDGFNKHLRGVKDHRISWRNK